MMPRSIARRRKRKYNGSNKYDQVKKAKANDVVDNHTAGSSKTADEITNCKSASKVKLTNVLNDPDVEMTDFNFNMTFRCLENLLMNSLWSFQKKMERF